MTISYIASGYDRLIRDEDAIDQIIDWEGVTDEKGNPIKYTKEKFKEIFGKNPYMFRDMLNMIKDVISDKSLW